MDKQTRKMIDDWVEQNIVRPKKPEKKSSVFDGLITVYNGHTIEYVL